MNLYTKLKFGCLWQGVYTLLLHTDQGVRRVALSLVKSLEKFRYVWTLEIYTTLSIQMCRHTREHGWMVAPILKLVLTSLVKLDMVDPGTRIYS